MQNSKNEKSLTSVDERTRDMEQQEMSTGREFWFPVRDRGAGLCGRRSLLIADRYGVYSFALRRYIRKTRYHRHYAMSAELAPIVRVYRSLQKLGMKNWPEHDEGRRAIRHWKRRLMDMYWDTATDQRRASATDHYMTVRYRHMMIYPSLAFYVFVMFGMMLLGWYTPTWRLLVCHALPIGSAVVLIEKVMLTTRWIALSRSEIHQLLEFELAN